MALKVRGIDQIVINSRGGDWKTVQAQRVAKWIYNLDTVVPKGLNENINYVPFIS